MKGRGRPNSLRGITYQLPSLNFKNMDSKAETAKFEKLLGDNLPKFLVIFNFIKKYNLLIHDIFNKHLIS